MKLLVVDGNTHEGNMSTRAQGLTPYCETYAMIMQDLALTYLKQEINVEIAHASEIEHDATHGHNSWFATHDLSEFDGFIWTGSPLNLYNPCPAITNQLKFGEKLLQTGKPVFGSCWGLQINAQLLGGKVRKNPKGREIGIARNILINETAVDHWLFAQKPRVFNALAIHLDEIETIPQGAKILASNPISNVQAMAYQDNGVDFCGVQYHPEFNFTIMAFIYQRIEAQLIAEGFCHDQTAVDKLITDYRALAAYHEVEHGNPRPDLSFTYGVTACVTDLDCHRRELKNWLQYTQEKQIHGKA